MTLHPMLICHQQTQSYIVIYDFEYAFIEVCLHYDSGDLMLLIELRTFQSDYIYCPEAGDNISSTAAVAFM